MEDGENINRMGVTKRGNNKRTSRMKRNFLGDKANNMVWLGPLREEFAGDEISMGR